MSLDTAPGASLLQWLADEQPALLVRRLSGRWCCVWASGVAQAGWGAALPTPGRPLDEVLCEPALSALLARLDLLAGVQASPPQACVVAGLDGRPRTLSLRRLPADLEPPADPDEQAVSVLVRDFSAQARVEAALREAESRLDKFMHATGEGIVFHRDGRVTDANPVLCAMVGYSLDEAVGRPVLDFVAEDQREQVLAVMRTAQETRYESVILHRSGARIPVEFTTRTLVRGGEHLRMGIIRDIRDKVAAQQRIYHLAHHDALTQLLNRAAFMVRMNALLDQARHPPQRLALLFIDLDNFKRVNDSLGHQEGDKVLSTVAERISSCLRGSDLVGRFGGDEFIVLLSDVSTRADVQTVLSALLAVVEVPVQADGRDLCVTPSIGVALYPEHGRSAEELIQHADAAMYLAKSSGRANYRFFEPALAARAYAELVLESELAQALTRNEFELFYQPQVDAGSGQLVGAEALLRWRHPRRGLLSPEAFIDVAERHRLMLPLSEWVMREAARQSRAWHESGVAAVPIAVNLSSMQFRLEDFDGLVAEVLKDAGVPGQWLELELTERMLMDDIEHVPQLLQSLRAMGLSISVDDFGTGYTSLSHLARLPVDKLKIDQSFVAKLPQDKGALAITRAIVQMGLGLDLQLSAEGVRDPAQAALLAEWGCHSLQGELIGAPMAVPEFERWLQERV